MSTATTVRSAARTTRRLLSTTAEISHHNTHQETHKYLESNKFIGSWETPRNPKEAEAKLAMLRREYAKQVKEVRKEYIKEMELMRIEKERKDEAKKEALRIANEERKKLKAEAAKLKAQERQIAQQEFRQLLLNERAQKLESWRMKERIGEEKKTETGNLLRRQVPCGLTIMK
ncbi:beta-mannosyltransferase 1 isoform X2 [Mercurialis annua]|uniref:beta-mannosyltransferase 1 isoform X2 n=1 Tax=Mercurialis annua TaxID=3986 RepID=UPI00215EA7E4|nr:beta-mannosyltransferase 1 isoform X2 [Mercurialis annua]